MASLEDAEEVLRSTKSKSNFQRLTRLLMGGGAVLLREIFDSIHSPTNLPTTLSDPLVERKLRTARLTRPDWNCLYPSPGVYGKSSDFDISLTFRLLRTICKLKPPPTGWDSLPNNSEHSPEADLVRIKYYRNEVYGHSRNLEISDDQFLDLWEKISKALLRIARKLSLEKQSRLKCTIEKFLQDPLTPEEERYADELEQWYEKDIDNKKLVQELVEEVRVMKEEVATLRLVTTFERTAQFGLVVAPYEGQDNEQEISAQVDMWNVIMSFKDSFRALFRYVRNKLNAIVEDIELGSLSIAVRCSSLQILEGLWEDYISGHLNQVVQETLVTHEVLEILGLNDLKLKVCISEEEYEKGKKVFADNSETLVTYEVLEILDELKLKVCISEEEYEKGKKVSVIAKPPFHVRPLLSFGIADGMFQNPEGMAVSERDEIILADTFNHRVQVFDSNGTFLRSFGCHGQNPGQFSHPYGVAIDNNGNIFISEWDNHRVQIFSGEGRHLGSFGRKGSHDSQLLNPRGLSVDSAGNVIVADKGNKQIKIFTPDGKFVMKIGGQGSFRFPAHCVQCGEYLIVSDSFEHCIKVFNREGHFQYKFGKQGEGDGEFKLPAFLSATQSKHLLVCDRGNDRIQIFELDGVFVGKFGTKGSKLGQFNEPVSVAVLSNDQIVVCDANKRIQIFEQK